MWRSTTSSGIMVDQDCEEIESLSSIGENSAWINYRICDFDSCRLVKVSDKAEGFCALCLKDNNKNVKTPFICKTCNIRCCVDCYDCHRRNQFIGCVRFFRQNKTSCDVKVSKCGEYFEVDKKDIGYHLQLNQMIGHNMNNYMSRNSSVPRPVKIPSTDSFCPKGQEKEQSTDLGQKSLNDIQSTMNLLKEKYGVFPQFLFDSENKLKCIFIQDSYMKDFFNFFYERICLHVLGRVNSLNSVLYLLSAENSNGSHEIISLFLNCTEDEESITLMLKTFITYNPLYRRNIMFVVDTLIENRKAVKLLFPDSQVLSCIYHVSRAFNYHLTQCEASSTQINHYNFVLKIIENMNLACTNNQLLALHKQFLSDDVEFLKAIKTALFNEWKFHLGDAEDILFSLNSFLQFVDEKFKPLLCTEISLFTLVERFFYILKLLRSAKKCEAITKCNFYNPLLYSQYTPQYQIAKLLTRYAAKFVLQQLEISENFNMTLETPSESCMFSVAGITVAATVSTCSCMLYLLTSLPCAHIFALRRAHLLPAFDEALIKPTSWTEEYYVNTYEHLHNHPYADVLPSARFLKASELVDKLIPAISVCAPNIFEHRFSVLDEITSAWKESRLVQIHFDGAELEANISVVSPSVSDDNSSINEILDLEKSQDTEPVIPAHCSNSDSPEVKPQFLDSDWDIGRHLLEGSHINFIYLCVVICKTKETCIKWLQHMNFLPVSMTCPSCGSEMVQKNISRLSDGAIWTCKKDKEIKKSCSRRCAVRRGTWFEGTNMALEQILSFVYLWIYDFPQQYIISELRISAATYGVWDKSFSTVCAGSLKEQITEDQAESHETAKSAWRKENNTGKDIFASFLACASHLHNTGRFL